jgi:hypothetical protein
MKTADGKATTYSVPSYQRVAESERAFKVSFVFTCVSGDE